MHSYEHFVLVLALAFSHIWLTCTINLTVLLSVVGFNESNFYFYFYSVSFVNC